MLAYFSPLLAKAKSRPRRLQIRLKGAEDRKVRWLRDLAKLENTLTSYEKAIDVLPEKTGPILALRLKVKSLEARIIRKNSQLRKVAPGKLLHRQMELASVSAKVEQLSVWVEALERLKVELGE